MDSIIAFPKNPYKFYIELYCKKKSVKLYPGERLSAKGKKRRLVSDATKSWHVLNESEKQKIILKYKEYKAKLKEHISNSLKEAEPFMKRKCSKRKDFDVRNTTLEKTNESHETEIVNEDLDTLETEENVNLPAHQQEQEVQSIASNDISAVYNHVSQDMEHDVEESQQENNKDSDEDSESGTSVQTKIVETILTAPTPPNIMNGKDLFNMYNSKNGEQESWSSLSLTIKLRYSRAATLLKKDYITKYKQYLESLPPRELFEHYNKTSF